MQNIPKIKVGVVAVSRDCFPESLSVGRRRALISAYHRLFGKDADIYECPVCIVESEKQMLQAYEDVVNAGCNALCVYLGNFGPEIAETMLAQRWVQKTGYPVMFCAALISGQLLTKAGVPLALCLLIAILVGFLFGAFNGVLVAYAGVPPFITSMAGMMIAKGVGSVATKTQSISWPQIADASGWYRNLIKINIGSFTFPVGLVILLAVAAVCAVVLNKTLAGRYILCLGSNKEAVRLSGINVRRWEMLAYIICGTLAGVAAIFYVGAYTTVQPGLGDTFNNDAIASCVMGGTSMAGGIASISGTVIGTMIIALLQEGIMAMGFQKDYQYVITGIIVVISVCLDVRSKMRKN